MQQGLWADAGTPYTLDISGTLIDGQHRLEALIRWGEAVPIIVVVTKDPNAYRALDVGKRRTVRDFYKSRTGTGINGSVVSAIMTETLDFSFASKVSPRQQDNLIERYDQLDVALMFNHLRCNAGQIASALRSCRLHYDHACDFFDAALENKQHIDGTVVPHLELLTKAWMRLKTDTRGGRDSVLGGRYLRPTSA